MYKKKKIKLAVLCTIVLTVILVLITIAFSIISVRSIRKIGNFAVTIDEKNVRNISKNLFLEITRRTAREYSHYFSDAEEVLGVLSKEVIKKTLEHKKTDNSEPDDDIELHQYKNTNFFVSNPGISATVFYWGNTVNNQVPGKVLKQIDLLDDLSIVFNGFLHHSMDYYCSIWVHGKDHFMFIVPESDVYYKNITDKKTFSLYFDNFDILSVHKNEDNKTTKPCWLKPYKDVTGLTVLSVFSPIFDAKGNVDAAVGLDLDLDKLLKTMLTSRLLVSSNKTEDGENENIFHGFLFLIDKNASIIAFPPDQADLFSLPINYSDLKNSAEFIQTKLLDTKDVNLREAVVRMLKTGSGVETLDLKGDDYFIAYCNLESTGWILGFVVSDESLTAPAAKTRTEMNNTEVEAIKHGFIISLIFLIISIIISLAFFKKYLFNRVETMIYKIRKMAKGEFQIKFREEGISEIAELATNFNFLGSELKKYMKNLEKEIKAREQIEAEVKVAADVQRSMLPVVNDNFKSDEFEIAVMLSPAKEASGDFYDFFYVDDKLALIIADVAGKGISAAFFMGMVKTLLKNVCMHERNNPARALNMVNRILSQDNSSMMFVTLFLGYYDIKSGKMVYANAGHHEAICLSKNGMFRKFGRMKGIAVGVTDAKRYKSNKTFIGKNDKIVLYTDGVVEAVSPAEEDYGDNRFRQYLIKNRFCSCDGLANGIIKEIRTFERDKRYDDVTVLILERKI